MIFTTHSFKTELYFAILHGFRHKNVLAAENYGDSQYVISFVRHCRLQKQTTKMWKLPQWRSYFCCLLTKRQCLIKLITYSESPLFSAANTYFGHENRGVLRTQFGFEWICSEYHVLRLAGAEVHYKIAVESEGSLPGVNTVTHTSQ